MLACVSAAHTVSSTQVSSAAKIFLRILFLTLRRRGYQQCGCPTCTRFCGFCCWSTVGIFVTRLGVMFFARWDVSASRPLISTCLDGDKMLQSCCTFEGHCNSRQRLSSLFNIELVFSNDLRRTCLMPKIWSLVHWILVPWEAPRVDSITPCMCLRIIRSHKWTTYLDMSAAHLSAIVGGQWDCTEPAWVWQGRLNVLHYLRPRG